jgi:hypothetical protein
MLKYTINKFLDLRFEDGKTNIYVNNELFMHCKYILLNLNLDNFDYFSEIDSIDDIVEKLDASFEVPGVKKNDVIPEMLFWAHCSNLQAWYENNYNTCLIHSNLAFPLLKELTKAGDLRARRIFKEEVGKRLESKNLNVIQFLLYNEYLNYLNKEELEVILEQTRVNLSEIVFNQLNVLMKSIGTKYWKIKELIDILLFIDLKYNENMLLCIFSKLNKNLRLDFARFLIMHLNYKEFRNYKVPYGKFFLYFEKFLDLIYENFPEIKDLLKIVNSGFLSGALPMDEKLSYGAVSYQSTV